MAEKRSLNNNAFSGREKANISSKLTELKIIKQWKKMK
jgi:hypothetical protein